MNKLSAHLAAVCAAVALSASVAVAAPAKGKTAAKPAALTCPACKMTLSTKKTKDTPVAVKIKGKTYYCCSKCDMHAKKGGAASAHKHS